MGKLSKRGKQDGTILQIVINTQNKKVLIAKETLIGSKFWKNTSMFSNGPNFVHQVLHLVNIR